MQPIDLRQVPTQRFIQTLLMASLGALAMLFFIYQLVQLFKVYHTPGVDFLSYYNAAINYTADPASLYKINRLSVDEFVYPPPAILLFTLFTLWKAPIAYLLFTLLVHAVSFASLCLLINHGQKLGWQLSSIQVFFLMALFMASAPAYHNLLLGQVNGLVLFLSVLFVVNFRTKPILAAIVLAVAVWIKVYPVLLLMLPVLHWRSHQRLLFIFGLSFLLIPLLLLPILPAGLYTGFFTKLSVVSKHVCSHIVNQSLPGFLIRFSLPQEKVFAWPNLYLISPYLKYINYVAGVLLAGVTAWKIWPSRGQLSASHETIAFICLLAVGCVISPVAWGHTYMLAIPLFTMAIWHAISQQKGFMVWVAVVTGACLLMPVYTHINLLDALPFSIANFFYSRLLILALLAMVYLLFFATTPAANPILKGKQ
jgi:hypothetical protein